MTVSTYLISFNSCFTICMVLVVPIYCINHLLVSATHFNLALLSGRYYYQLSVSGSSISLVVVSSSPLSYFYQHTLSAIRYSPISYTHQVMVPCTWIKPSITYLYQLHRSLMGIFYPDKILVSDIPINYPYLTSRFLCS